MKKSVSFLLCAMLVVTLAIPTYAGPNQDSFKEYCDSAVAAIDNRQSQTTDAIDRNVLTDKRKAVIELKNNFKETDDLDAAKEEVEAILKELGIFLQGDTTSMDGGGTTATSEQAKQAQAKLGIDDGAVAELMASWVAAKQDGWSDEALAGVYGNLYCESNFKPDIIERNGVGPGIGMPQWTTSSEHQLAADWATKCTHAADKKKMLVDVTICIDRGCQMLLFLKEDIPHKYIEQKNDAVKCMAKHNEKVKALNIADARLVRETYATTEELMKSTEVASAAVSIMGIPEQPKASFYGSTDRHPANEMMTIYGKVKTAGQWYVEECAKRIDKAELCFTLFTGSDMQPDKDAAKSVAEQMASAGYWTEEELSEYARLTEINIDDILSGANRKDIGGEDLEGLSWWERNVMDNKATGGVVGFIRKLVQFAGIMFIIWVIFIYLAYWFDRINNFFYIDMLGVLTIGFLHMSDTEEECTFKLRDLGKGDRRTVNHRAILEVCLLGIFFGVFIVTGAYYKVIMWIIQYATRLFSKWF